MINRVRLCQGGLCGTVRRPQTVDGQDVRRIRYWRTRRSVPQKIRTRAVGSDQQNTRTHRKVVLHLCPKTSKLKTRWYLRYPILRHTHTYSVNIYTHTRNTFITHIYVQHLRKHVLYFYTLLLTQAFTPNSHTAKVWKSQERRLNQVMFPHQPPPSLLVSVALLCSQRKKKAICIQTFCLLII